MKIIEDFLSLIFSVKDQRKTQYINRTKKSLSNQFDTVNYEDVFWKVE